MTDLRLEPTAHARPSALGPAGMCVLPPNRLLSCVCPRGGPPLLASQCRSDGPTCSGRGHVGGGEASAGSVSCWFSTPRRSFATTILEGSVDMDGTTGAEPAQGEGDDPGAV